MVDHEIEKDLIETTFSLLNDSSEEILVAHKLSITEVDIAIMEEWSSNNWEKVESYIPGITKEIFETFLSSNKNSDLCDLDLELPFDYDSCHLQDNLATKHIMAG